MKKCMFIFCLLFTLSSFSQSTFKNKQGIYSFKMPYNFKSKPSDHERNEFIFTSQADTTSLVVNVNVQNYNIEEELTAFKKASDAEVETRFFAVLKNPKIVKRGEINTYKEQSIYFHVIHEVSKDAENDYMMNYMFYHKDKLISFIFRTKERRLRNVLPYIEEIVNSVKLL